MNEQFQLMVIRSRSEQLQLEARMYRLARARRRATRAASTPTLSLTPRVLVRWLLVQLGMA